MSENHTRSFDVTQKAIYLICTWQDSETVKQTDTYPQLHPAYIQQGRGLRPKLL